MCDHLSQESLVSGISLPDWDDLPSVKLLRSLDYYYDCAFNHHLLDTVIDEVSVWLRYETDRGDPHERADICPLVRVTAVRLIPQPDGDLIDHGIEQMVIESAVVIVVE